MVCVVAVVLRVVYVAQPMRYDESVTYLFFVRLPLRQAIATYTYPNNHILHTVLAKAAVTAFGNSPVVLRLPAFVAGVLVVPAAYAVARELYGARAALLAAGICATSGALVLYSTNARGYTLVVLMFLLLVLAGARLVRGSDVSDWLDFVAIAAFGLWAIPTMLFPFGAVALWIALSLLVEGRDAKPRLLGLVAAIAGTAAFTLTLYSPVIAREGFAAITRNKFVAPTGWYRFLGELLETGREAFASWSLGTWPVVYVILAACALLSLYRHAVVSRFKVGLPLAAFVWCAWLLAVNHRAPFARVWLWAIPLFAALAGAGALYAAASLPRRWPARLRFEVVVVVLTVGVGANLLRTRAVLSSTDTGTYRDAGTAAAILARSVGRTDRVIAAIPTNAPLAYYLDRLGVTTDVFGTDERSAGRVFVIVDRAEHQTAERVLEGSLVRDSTRFGHPKLFARLPASDIIVFHRVNDRTR